MVSGLCSVLMSEWDQLEIEYWVPFQELQSKGWACYYGQKEVLFACSPAIYQDLEFDVKRNVVPTADVGVLGET
jgi:hypothetical protein